MQGDPKSYYEILQVSPDACNDVINAAFRALLRFDDGQQRLREEAFETLLDEDGRFEYDQYLARKNYGKNIIGNYEVLSLIFEDGFGKTYKARHLLTGEFVRLMHAHKISAFSARVLKEETKKAWDLRHHSLPIVRDLFSLPTDNRLVLVTSYIEGMTIEKQVLEYGKMDLEHIAWIIERCLYALRYMHDRGVIHGGINPRNTMIQKNHEIVFLGSNFARVDPSVNKSPDGFESFFMPPEQIKKENLWPETDYFSLGATAIYAISGSLEEVKKLKVPENIPSSLREFLKELVLKDHNYRPRENDKLLETYIDVRYKSFGKIHSNMKPIPGLS